MTATIVPAAELFRTEIIAARNLGFRVQVRVEDAGAAKAAYARLLPFTANATAACAPNTAIEARQAFSDVREHADAIKSAIDTALEFARDAAT